MLTGEDKLKQKFEEITNSNQPEKAVQRKNANQRHLNINQL